MMSNQQKGHAHCRGKNWSCSVQGGSRPRVLQWSCSVRVAAGQARVLHLSSPAQRGSRLEGQLLEASLLQAGSAHSLTWGQNCEQSLTPPVPLCVCVCVEWLHLESPTLSGCVCDLHKPLNSLHTAQLTGAQGALRQEQGEGGTSNNLQTRVCRYKEMITRIWDHHSTLLMEGVGEGQQFVQCCQGHPHSMPHIVRSC